MNMKQNKLHLNLFIVGIIYIAFSSQAFCQGDDMALLVQISPPGAGVVTPEPGVHRFTSDSRVNLSAVPNQGFQFVYWLGDVIEPAKENTLAMLDGPKIIVAVFEKSNFPFASEEQFAAFSPGSDGGGFRSAADFRTGVGGGIIRSRRRLIAAQQPPPSDDGDEDEEEPELPVPEVPEPATGGMLLLGTIMLLKRRKQRHRNC
jgi:hypothetical protein